MSTVRLLKDHGPHRAGADISVKFGEGRRLIAEGIGVYPGTPAAEPPGPGPAAPAGDMAFAKKQQDRVVALEAEIADLQAENARLQKENGDLAVELEQATKTPADKKHK